MERIKKKPVLAALDIIYYAEDIGNLKLVEAVKKEYKTELESYFNE